MVSFQVYYFLRLPFTRAKTIDKQPHLCFLFYSNVHSLPPLLRIISLKIGRHGKDFCIFGFFSPLGFLIHLGFKFSRPFAFSRPSCSVDLFSLLIVIRISFVLIVVCINNTRTKYHTYQFQKYNYQQAVAQVFNLLN